jgi:hypothetical protein
VARPIMAAARSITEEARIADTAVAMVTITRVA